MCATIRAGMPERRYRHVLGVARAAEKLAARHGASSYAARIAGLLHDVARQWAPAELLSYARERGMSISPIEAAEPLLLHARIGAEIARHRFGVDDDEILRAIANHTVARPRMSVLEKCVYLADGIEPTRTYADRAAIAELAMRDLDAAFFVSVRSSIRYLLENAVPIAPETIEVYNAMVNEYAKKPS